MKVGNKFRFAKNGATYEVTAIHNGKVKFQMVNGQIPITGSFPLEDAGKYYKVKDSR